MERSLWRLFACGLVVAGGALAARPASTATYSETLNVSASDFRCGYFNGSQACYTGRGLTGGPRAGAAGDVYNIDVTFDQRLYVPGSSRANIVNVSVVDTSAVLGAAAPGPLLTRGTLLMDGYIGPDNPLEGPFDLNSNFSHPASGGFCCGYGVPNEGFSLTGADATIEILAPGDKLLSAVVAGFEVYLGETPEALADFQGGAPDAPVFLPDTLVGQVTGNIAGAYGPESFYGFTWEGGLFQTRARVLGANVSDAFDFKLYRFGDYDAPLAFQLLDTSNNFNDLVTAALDPGIYVVGLMTSTGVDPQFTIDFLTPVGDRAIPEPSTWWLMIGGFGALGVAARRRRAGAIPAA